MMRLAIASETMRAVDLCEFEEPARLRGSPNSLFCDAHCLLQHRPQCDRFGVLPVQRSGSPRPRECPAEGSPAPFMPRCFCCDVAPTKPSACPLTAFGRKGGRSQARAECPRSRAYHTRARRGSTAVRNRGHRGARPSQSGSRLLPAHAAISLRRVSCLPSGHERRQLVRGSRAGRMTHLGHPVDLIAA